MFDGNEEFPRTYTTRREPTIHRKIDGPMLLCTNGNVHFLKLWDRIKYKLGLVKASELETKYERQEELMRKYRQL